MPTPRSRPVPQRRCSLRRSPPLGELAGERGRLAWPARSVRCTTGIAERVWSSVGPAAAPVRIVHDRIADARLLRDRPRADRGVRRGGAGRSACGRAPEAPSIESTPQRPRRRSARSTAPSATCSRSAATAWRWPMTMRVDRPRCPDRPDRSCERAYPRCELRGWRSSCTACARPRRRGGSAPPATSPTATACRPSSATRRSTSATTPAATSPRTVASSRALLERGHRAWPVQVSEIALIGHSMGGLVARSAMPLRRRQRRGAAVAPRVHARRAAPGRAAGGGGLRRLRGAAPASGDPSAAPAR